MSSLIARPTSPGKRIKRTAARRRTSPAKRQRQRPDVFSLDGVRTWTIVRGGEERTGLVRRTTNADQYRRRWLDRTPKIDISRLEWSDIIQLARKRRCLYRSHQHISTRTRENSERKRNRHRRRYAGGACEQLAPFTLQPGGCISERHACNAIV